jgi:hypothetical protein
MADLDLVKELARAADYLAVFCTTRPDSTVHASLVKAGILDDAEDGEPSVGIVVAGSAIKLEHLRRSKTATVVFKDGWRWVAVGGPARLEGPDHPPPTGSRQVADVVRDVYRSAGGTHDDWDAFDRVMAEDRRCAVFVKAHDIFGNG